MQGLAGIYSFSDTSFTLRDISFLNSQTGFISGSGNSYPFTDIYAKIFRTTNAGISWDSLNTRFNCRIYGLLVTSQESMIAYGERSYGGAKSLYVTTNSGLNWIPSDMTNRSLDLKYFNPGFLLTISNDNKVYKSSTNGINWYVFSEFPYNNYFTGVGSFEFTDVSFGLGVGSNGMITKTTNSGLNWTSQFTNNNADWIWGVDFVNENTGYAADDFHLLKTTNGGINWNSVFAHGLYHLDFIDANTGYFGGEDSLFKTTNGGITITQVNYSNAPGVLNEIQFLNANTGFILGKNNLTWKTTNGGINWNILTGYGIGYHECLFFYNEILDLWER